MAGILRVDQANVDYIYAKTTGGKTYIPGHIIQVQSTTKTDAWSTTSSSQVDITGYSVNITPTSSTSKILITAMLSTSHDGDDYGHSYMYLVRNSTNICIADTAGSRKSSTLVGNYLARQMQPFPFTFLDSPATTSSITYKTQFAKYSNGIVYLQVGSGVSTITLMEIAA